MSRPRGFTLIELLVVISIIALLASVVLASLNSARDKGRMGAGRYFAAQIDHAESDQAAALWDFDECSGGSSADWSGNNVNLSISGATFLPSTQSGKGCSLSFDGVNNYANTNSTSFLDGSTVGTISTWVNITSIGGTPYSTVRGAIIGKASTPDNALGFSDTTNKVRLRLGSTNLDSATALGTGVWYHIAAVWDPSGMRIYINGLLDSSNSVATAVWTSSGYTTAVGRMYQGSTNGSFNGLIDSLHVFAKALTASEVAKLYASEAPRFKLADR